MLTVYHFYLNDSKEAIQEKGRINQIDLLIYCVLFQFTPPTCKDIRRPRRGAMKNLFAGKRTMETEDLEKDLSPCIKKIRQGETSLLKLSLTVSNP